MSAEQETIPTAAEADKKRKQRNVAIALSVVAFVVIIYLVTIMRIGGAVVERSF